MKLSRLLSALALALLGLPALAQTPPPLEPPPPVWCPITGGATAGTLDSCYGYVNKGIGIGPNGMVREMVAQPDGMVILGGDFTSYHGLLNGHIARIRKDGYVDSAFSAGTGFDGPVYSLALQPDGKILVGGDFRHYQGSFARRVARLNANGTIDATFNADTANNLVSQVELAPDGKVLIHGSFTTVRGRGEPSIARLNANGSLDTTFQVTDILAYQNIGVQSDGKVVFSTFVSFTNPHPGFGRFNTDGSMDASFTADPSTRYRQVYVLPDNRLLAYGAGNSALSGIDRYGADGGAPDAGFQGPIDLTVSDLAIHPTDGSIYVSTSYLDSTTGQNSGVVHLLPNGSLDASYTLGAAANGTQQIVYAGGEDKHTVVYGRDRQIYQDALLAPVNALDSAGMLVDNFQNRPDYFDAPVTRLRTHWKGKRLATGGFESVGFFPNPQTALIKPNGLPDAEFYLVDRPADVYGMPDGQIVGVSGSEVVWYDTLGARISAISLPINLESPGIFPLHGRTALIIGRNNAALRLMSDGTIDPNFANSATGCALPTANIQDVVPVAGGKMLVAGNIPHGLALLDSTGTSDANFATRLPIAAAPTSCADGARRIVIQPDGKILVAGRFQFEVSATAPYYGLIRLKADGSLDSGFVLRPNVVGPVMALALQPDGKILVAGGKEPGQPYQPLERLLPDGSPDPTFQIVEGIDGSVDDLVLDGNGVIAAGQFTRAGGKARTNLARFFIGNLVATRPDVDGLAPLRVAPNPTTGIIRVSAHQRVELLTATGRSLGTVMPRNGIAEFDLSRFPAGLYLVRSGSQSARVVRQ